MPLNNANLSLNNQSQQNQNVIRPTSKIQLRTNMNAPSYDSLFNVENNTSNTNETRNQELSPPRYLYKIRL